MSHWAEIDENNIVVRILVGDNNEPDEGEAFMNSLGGVWIKTSYNNNIRGVFAGVGYSYNQDEDIFVTPQPYASWSLDDNYDWQPPTPKPEGKCAWDESTLSWVDFETLA